MTDTATVEEPVTTVDLPAELLAKVDEFLAGISHQTIVEQPRVVDFTLDLRQIIKERTS